MHELSDIATDPSLNRIPIDGYKQQRYLIETTKEGINIRVIHTDYDIVTGYPIKK